MSPEPTLSEVVPRFQALVSEGRSVDAVRTLEALPASPSMGLARAIGWSWVHNFYRAREALARIDPGDLEPRTLSTYDRLTIHVEEGFRRQSEAYGANRRANLDFLDRSQSDLALRFRERLLDPLPYTWIRDQGEGVRFVHLLPGGLTEITESAGNSRTLRDAEEAVVRRGEQVLFFELRLGKLLQHFVALHPQLENGRLLAYYVLEPGEALFALHLLLGDFSRLGARGNVYYFVGSSCEDDLARFFAADPSAPLPQLTIQHPGGRVSGVAGRLVEEDKRFLAVAAASLRESYAGGAPVLLDRFRGRTEGGPLRVLLLTCRFTTVMKYSTRDVAQAFERLGCQTLVLMEERDIGRLRPRHLFEVMASFRPDLVFVINHLRSEYDIVFPSAVPYVSWVQDPMRHLLGPELIERLGDTDLTYFALPREWLGPYLDAGYKEIGHLPMAANDGIFRVTGERNSRYACDLAFVTHITPPRLPSPYESLLFPLMDAIRREDEGRGGREYYHSLLSRIAGELGIGVRESDWPLLVDLTFLYVVRYVTRTEPVSWAVEMGIDLGLWGSGWESLPQFARYARGPIENGPELRDLYASAKVHLHVNHFMNLHQRLFECIASGGFVLARSVYNDGEPGGLGEHLEIGRQVITFSGKDDFQRKLAHYLGDEEDRRRVIEAGRERVLTEHTYVARMRRVLEEARRRLERVVERG